MTAPLDTWNGLNDYLRSADEEAVKTLLQEEKKGRKRLTFILRLHGKFNVLRNRRECEELRQKYGAAK